MGERKSCKIPEPEVMVELARMGIVSLANLQNARLQEVARITEFEAYVRDHGINAAWVLSSLRRIRCEAKVRK